MKRKLLEQNVSFNELSVTVNENMALAKELGFLQVPVIILEDGSAFGGYRPDVVEAVALAQGVAA
jgi:glutaredoxin